VIWKFLDLRCGVGGVEFLVTGNSVKLPKKKKGFQRKNK